jgi:hypothetical protein
MHAVIVGLSDQTYEKLIALCTADMDHSWLATHLLERAIYDAPAPGHCKLCGEPFFRDVRKIGPPPVYCSDPCRVKGYQERKVRWWRKKGAAWRVKQRGRPGSRSPRVRSSTWPTSDSP